MILLLLVPALALAGSPRLDRLADPAIAWSEADDGTGRGLMQVTLGGQRLHLLLSRHHRLEAELAAAAPEAMHAGPRYFRGGVDGRDGTWARMASIDGGWTGAVWDGTALWLLDPAHQHGARARSLGFDPDGSVAFTLADIDLPGGFDDGSLAPGARADPASHGHGHGHAQRHMQPTAALPAPAPAGAQRFLRVTLVLDSEFQVRYGGNAAAVAAAVLNIVDGVYGSQVGVDVSLFHLRALAGNGTMTSSNANSLLSAFRTFVSGGNVPMAGVAHLLSGKDFDGSTVGLAYVGTVCNGGYATGIDQITFSQAFGGAVLAHEIGHNFNARHDSDGNACPGTGFIMAAALNTGNPASQFSSCSQSYFSQYLMQPLACLAPPPDLVFANGFQ